jgi:Ca2+/Na+ antiporter
MAIAASFGGPVFNLLVSMGGPILYATARNGAIPYRSTSGMLVLAAATVLALAFLLLSVPLRFEWRLARAVGVSMLVLYAVCQLVFVVAELEWVQG